MLAASPPTEGSGLSVWNDGASRERYLAAIQARDRVRQLPSPPSSQAGTPVSSMHVPSWVTPEIDGRPLTPHISGYYAPLTPPQDNFNKPISPPNVPVRPVSAFEQSSASHARAYHAVPRPPLSSAPSADSAGPFILPTSDTTGQSLTSSITPPPASPVYMTARRTHQPRPHLAINHAQLDARAVLTESIPNLPPTPQLRQMAQHPRPSSQPYQPAGPAPRTGPLGLPPMPMYSPPLRTRSAVNPHMSAMQHDLLPVAKSNSAPSQPPLDDDEDPRLLYLKARPGSRPPPAEEMINGWTVEERNGAIRNRSPVDIERLRRGTLVAFLKGQHPLVIEKDLAIQIKRERREARRAV